MICNQPTNGWFQILSCSKFQNESKLFIAKLLRAYEGSFSFNLVTKIFNFSYAAGRSAKSFSIPGDDTANTTVASADEFVWIDSYNRLVELQKLPWNTGDIFKAISQGKDMSQLPQDEAISGDLLPRLSYYLQVRECNWFFPKIRFDDLISDCVGVFLRWKLTKTYLIEILSESGVFR